MKYHELTAAALSNVSRDQTIVVVPIAAVEQHGPHMPTGTDTILCSGVVEALESRLPDQVLLTPTLWLGASSHHLRFGATLNSHLDVYIDTLCEIAKSILNDGFCRLLFVNGHGGNVDPMRVALRRLQPQYPKALLVGGSYWSAADDTIRATLEGDQKFVGHACEVETSLMLHLRPELVDKDQLQDAGPLGNDVIDGFFVSRDMVQRTEKGFTGRPDLATEAKGQAIFEAIVDQVSQLVGRLLAEPLGDSFDTIVKQR